MPSFCARCGAPLPLSSDFCPSCGSPVAAVAPAGRAAALPSGYPGSAGYRSPAKQGGALKIVLIVIAVVVGLGVIGTGVIGLGVWRISRGVHVTTNNNGTAVTVPGGAALATGGPAAPDSELGVPVYPGAVRQHGGLDTRALGGSMAMAHFTTTDSPGQVADFYKSRMGDGTVAEETGSNGGMVLNSGDNDSEHTMVTVGRGTGDDAGKTMIVIMHTKKNN